MPKKPAVQFKSKSKYKKNTRDGFFFLCSCIGTIIILILSGVSLNKFLEKPEVLGTRQENQEQAEKDKFEIERQFWLSVLEKSPSYLTGWVELAKLEYEKGSKELALGYLQKAREIDPNSDEVKGPENLFRQNSEK